MIAPLKICRVCKTIDPKHRPGSCAKIRCGRWAGNHAINDHPVEDETVKCPVRGEVHTFNACPRRKSASKKALKKAQKSYKNALVVGANKKHETPEPDHLERLFMTPEYSGVIERLFERFLQFLVSQDLIGRQQAVQILTHRASNGSLAEVTEPTQEDQQEQKTEFMEVDPKNSELTRLEK
jgi:hypothetical protein